MENENQEYLLDFEDLLNRINNLEVIVQSLLNPQLMYKRPDSDEYEKMTDTLDYLHRKVRELEDR